jgi:hypothetical protein
MSRIASLLKEFAAPIGNPAWLCFVWFGMTAGISLLESPVRFTVTALPRAMALDLGRVVFAALNKAEWAALVILLILVRTSGRAKDYWLPASILALILIAQSAWLLPELSMRAQMIVMGEAPAPSIAHGAYASLEIVKLLTLLWFGFRALRDVRV